ASALVIDDRTLARIDDGATIVTRDGQVEVPRDFDVVDTSQNGLFTSVAQFSPQQATSSASSTLRVDVNTETIRLPYQHGLQDGDAVRYFSGDGISVGGLQSNETYYVKRVDDSALTLSLTPSGSIIDLNLDNTTGVAHALLPGFKPSAVDTTDPTVIDLGQKHGLVDGYVVVYESSSGTPIGPLEDGESYFVTRVSDTKVKLSSTKDGAPIRLNSSVATGDGHFLIPITSTTKEAKPGAEKLTLRRENIIEALDSTGDRRVSAADNFIRGITNDAYLTDRSVLVIADDNADLYNGTGGITFGHSVGAGISIAVDEIRRTTEALIGNLKIDITQDTASAPGVGIDSNDEIYLGYNHGLTNGSQVTYSSGGESVIGGLRDGESYYVTLGTDSDNSEDLPFTLARSTSESSATFSDSSVNVTKNIIDLGYTHQFQLGDSVRYRRGDSPAIGGLIDGQTYFVIPVSSTRIALAEFGQDIDATVHAVFDPLDTVQANQLVFSYDHGFVQGQPVRYTDGGGKAIGGLVSGQTYYVNVVNPKTIEFLATATSGTPIPLSTGTAVGKTHTLQRGITHSASLITGASMTGPSHTINLGYWHGYETGTPLRYFSSGATITALTDDEVYYAIVDGEERIALASSFDDAILGQWQFVDAETGIKTSVFEIDNEHGYQQGDALVYSRNAYYTGPGVDPTSAISYVDPNGVSGTLTEGTTYYAIPVFHPTARVFDHDTDTYSRLSIGIKLALTQADALADKAITVQGIAVGVHGFYRKASRIAIDDVNADGSAQYFATDSRVELTAPTAPGSSHSLRLTFDTTSSLDETHGLGRVFTPTQPASATFNPASDLANNTITLPAHGLATGDRLVYDDGVQNNSSAAAIGGLYRGQVVYAIVTGDNTFLVAETPAKANSNTAITLDATPAVGTQHEFRKTAIDPTSTIHLGFNHGFKTGDQVAYSNGRGTSIDGLGHGNTYFVIVKSPTSIQLAASAKEAASGAPIELSPYFAKGSQHGFGRVFRPTPLVDGPTKRLQFSQTHPFQDGDPLTYSSGSGNAIGGLDNGGTYYVVNATADSVQLALTPGGTAITLDGTVATGTQHALATLTESGSVVSGGAGAVIAHNAGDLVSVT
ncbi:MAG: hypothetical protein MI861_15665, partial [Pirellulales bacterium]|nr:hypothetical protein [Pirellulales bacterium]